MEIAKGEKGCVLSWQADFYETTKCPKCDNITRIAFAAQEGPEETPYICHLHKNKEKEFWPHDAIAVAVYFCKNCFEATTLWNQA